MKNFFICDFFDFSRKFFKAFFAFFVLFFLNFSAFAEAVVYYRWTPYMDSTGKEIWDGIWSVTHTDGVISKAKFWSYWKKSEPNWEKTFNNTGGTADYPGYYPDPNQKKLAYTYFTGEHAVTAKLDSSPANELEELHIGDCYNSQADSPPSVGTNTITINMAGYDLKSKTLVLGSSTASVPSVNFALIGGGTLEVSEMSFAAASSVSSCTYNIKVETGTVLNVSGKMSFAAAPGASHTYEYNIEVASGTVLDVSSIELNDSRLTVNFTGDGTLKVGDAIFSAGKININVKNLEISGTFKNEAGATLSVSGLSSDSRKFVGDFENAGTAEFSGGSKNTFGGAVTNSGSAKFKDSAEGTFNGTFENSRTAEFSGGSKSRFVGAVTNSGSVEFKDSAEGTFSGTVKNSGRLGFSSSAAGTFSSEFSNSGTVDLENASSQIKFDGSFTNNQDGTVTLPDAAGASVTFGTGTATFSNKGTVYSSGLCTTVAFANPVTVTDSGTWIYTGGTTPGEVILKNISYNILILRGNLEVPGNLTANVIRVETDSLKIKGIISSDSIDVKTEKPIELTGKLTVGSAAFRLSENTDFQINKYELVFGTDAKKCAITSGAEKKLSFFGTAGSKINFYSASLDIIGDFYSEPDVLFNCDVHASEINTSGKQEYFGAVTVAGAAKTKFNASAVTFLGTTYIQNETEISATGAVAFSGDVKVSAGSASILADTVFSGDCNISVASGQFSIGDSTSPKNTVVETGKNVKFKDISDGDFYGEFNNRGNVSFENCGNIKICGDSVNSGGFSCSGISDFEISGTFKNEARATLSVSGASSDLRKFVGDFENAGTAEFSVGSKSRFVGAVTNFGSVKFKDSAEGTFSSAFSNSGSVDLKNASSQIKFEGKFTNNQSGTVTLPDSFGASVSFETRTATFSNLGTLNSSGLCTVNFANHPVTDGGTWVYTGGTKTGQVILSDISYNSLILRGNLEVPGNLTATKILVETDSLKIKGIISSEQVSLNTDNPIELDSDENINSEKIVLLKNAKFNLKGHKLVFGKAGEASLISNAAVNGLNLILSDSPLPSQGKAFFYSSVGTESARLAEIVSDADLEFFASEINTSGKQEYSGAVTVSGAAKTKFNASAVTFHGITDIQKETEISATGAVAFSSNLTVAANSPLAVSASEATFSGDVKVSAGALSVIAEKSFFRSDVNVSGKVDISGTAASAKNISWRTSADVSGNFVLLNGNITLSNNLSGKTPDISAGKDIVLLNGDSSSMYNDSVSADFNWRSDAEGIFKYSGRKNSNAVFPDAFPDGTKVSSEKFISSLSGLGNGVTLSAGKNFYCNGVNLEGDSAWNLKAGNNGNSENFAEAYASSIKNCNFSSSGNGISFLSAAESFDKTGNHKNVCFGHPEIAFARTVYDDVIEVSFKDSVSGKPVKIENSNNEIRKNIAENPTFLTYENNASKISFTGTFVDAECTESTDGKGDLEKFFIKAPEPWNTDATGKSPGEAQSTDMKGIHRSAVPYLNIVRAVSGNSQGLRDEHKNRIASYDGVAKRFDGVTDSCPPVLLAVRTGQELHEKLPEKQKTHDSHNFLEFQYSEEIFVNGGDSSVVNVQSSAELAGISNSSENGILVSGLAQFEHGKVSLGSESGIAPEKLNSIYRNFAVSLSKGESPQTHRFRISLAGYQSQTAAENPSGFPYWPGYIDSDNTQMPSGKITLLPHGNHPSAENQKFNDFIKDSEGNSLLVKSQENHPLKNLSVISDSSGDIYNPDWNDSVYGIWDLSAPVFAVYRSFNSNGAAKSSESYEVLGACKTSGTFLDRIEFHVFDNSELDFGGAEWFSQFGWGKDKNVLFTGDSYASDIFGGSRPFGNSPGGSARTSGGIRYSTLYNKSSYFNYGVDYETPASEFKNSRIESGAFSTLFLSKIGDKREISSGDSLYFSVFLKDGTKLPLKTNFSVRYDQQGCVTDLAGNLMKSAKVKSVDRVSPRFNMTSAKVSGNKLYVVFNKEINLEPVELEFSDGRKKSFGISDSLRFIKIPADGHKFEDSDVVYDLYIEKETAPLKIYSSGTFTGLIFTLNRNVTLKDVKNYYIQSFSPESGKFIDPFTGIKDVKVTAITDVNGNYMSHGDAHALSDFAVDVVNPVYAYDDRFMEEKFGFSASAAAQSNLSVREWDEDQQKDGTLLTEHNLFVVTSQDSGNSEDAESLPEKIIMYYDKSPDSDSVSKEYNKNLEQNLRVWIPSLVPVDTSGSSTERIYSLTALASATNSNNLFAVGEVSKNIAKFTLDWETMEKNGYSSGNQVSFLFGLAEPDGSPVKICHAPSYDEITGVYRLEPQPLFALRLKNSNDPVSLDLWSFRLKSAVLQRGNVTIFNNVIDVNKGEMSVVRVNMPSEGRLDVIVMTLDGNIIRYLQHGTASAGEHNYSWNGTSKSGKKVARGLYFVRVFGNGIDETRKIMVVKN